MEEIRGVLYNSAGNNGTDWAPEELILVPYEGSTTVKFGFSEGKLLGYVWYRLRGREVDAAKIREILGRNSRPVEVDSKWPSQVVRNITEKIDTLPDVEGPPRQRRAAHRVGTWRVPVLDGEFTLERESTLLRIFYRTVEPRERAEFILRKTLEEITKSENTEFEFLPPRFDRLDKGLREVLVSIARDELTGPHAIRQDTMRGEVLRAILRRFAIFLLPDYPIHMRWRDEELSRLLAIQAQGEDTDINLAAVEAGPVVGLWGMTGVGKTTLAVALSHLWRLQPLGERSASGERLLLRGKNLGGAVRAIDLLASAVRALRPGDSVVINENDIEGSRARLLTKFREVMTTRRVLLMLDDAQDAAQVEQLRPSLGSVLVYTSQLELEVVGQSLHAVSPLTSLQSKAVLREWYPWFNDAQGDMILDLCSGLPQALRVVSSQLNEQAGRNARGVVGEYLQKLKTDRLRVLREGASDAEVSQLTLVQSLEMSAAELTAEQRQMWRRMSVFNNDFDWKAVHRVASDATGDGMAEAEANTEAETATREALGALVRRSLLQLSGERYELQNIVQEVAAEQLGDGAERFETRLRHAEHYLGVLREADRLHQKGGASQVEGLALFDREWDDIQVGQSWTGANAARDERAARLCLRYSTAGGHIIDLRLTPSVQIEWLTLGLETLENWPQLRQSETKTEAAAWHNLGLAHVNLGDMATARPYFERSLDIAQAAGEVEFEAVCRANYGWALYRSQDRSGALRQYRRSLRVNLRIYDERKRSEARATVLGNLGIAYKDSRSWRTAIKYQRLTMAEARKIEDRRLEAQTWGNLGLAYQLQERFVLAKECLEKQVEMALELNDRRGQGKARVNLAQLAHDTGHIAEAIKGNLLAISLLSPLGDPQIPELEQDIVDWQKELNAESAALVAESVAER